MKAQKYCGNCIHLRSKQEKHGRRCRETGQMVSMDFRCVKFSPKTVPVFVTMGKPSRLEFSVADLKRTGEAVRLLDLKNGEYKILGIYGYEWVKAGLLENFRCPQI